MGSRFQTSVEDARGYQRRYAELNLSEDPKDHIHNCQILQYTRRDPASGELKPYCGWMRSICPTDLKKSHNEWEPIVRPTFSNADLLAEV